MKKYFLTGLVLLLPFILTVLILEFVLDFLTTPFIGPIASFLGGYPSFQHNHQIAIVFSKFIVLVGLVFFTLILGMIGQVVIGRYIEKATDALFHRIPFIGKIYKATKNLVHTLIAPKETQPIAQRVVLVPFPHSHSKCIGFVVNDRIVSDINGEEDRASVFIPGTPNPMMGFILLFRKKDMIPLGISVEQTMKFLVSCGVVAPLDKKS